MHLNNLFSASSLFLILSWVRTLMFLLLVQDVPVSFGQENVDSSNCSVLNFTCGDLIKNISYPFWGNLRPPYCGMPGYKLDCLDGGITEIEIVSEKYRVLGIDQGNKIMTITRNDFLGEDDACLADGFDTITPNFTLFNYPPDKLTLNYGCPAFPGSNTFPNKFNCETNETSNTDAYYWSGILASAGINSPPNSVRCWKSIEVPVTVTALRRLSNDPSTTTLSSVLRAGFDVGYSDAGCHDCMKNGGECRYSSASLTCFCPSSVTNRTLCSVPGT
ncbi:hypothetical protein BVC80_1211g19 [Macleaya cordata]|uniref:Wall-associated receptor kinase galacturonan-binding domain n=1 Tax=Macleaya cordata TaxID=56857 RepID=A0A200Q3D1_MACCD|nr:hypothetical protein BVC80_1211g19 [Macleaya cordata]